MKTLNAYLTGPQASVEAWEAALYLHELALAPPPPIHPLVARRWRFLAATECVLELYHLRSRLEKIQSVQLRACPSLRPLIDMAQLRAARRQLDIYFPDIEALRHATAHRGENEAHPEVHAPDDGFMLVGFRDDPRIFGDYYEGQRRVLSITCESLDKMSEVVTQFFAAFELAAEELCRQGHLDD